MSAIFRRGTLLMLSGPVEHLHVVMNDPIFSGEHGKNSVLVVNVTSVKQGVYFDPTCVLTPGCHPFVNRESYVVYKHAVVLGVDRLVEGCAAGEVRPHQAASPDLFTTIRDGFDQSKHVHPKIARFIRVNGL